MTCPFEALADQRAPSWDCVPHNHDVDPSSPLSSSILIMSAPPRVRWRLGPAGRRVFPLFLAAIRGEIEERPNAAERFDATPLGEVGAIHIVAVAQEDAEAERFPFGGRATEVDVEVIVRGLVPRQRPAHALSVRLDVGPRRA